MKKMDSIPARPSALSVGTRDKGKKCPYHLPYQKWDSHTEIRVVYTSLSHLFHSSPATEYFQNTLDQGIISN